MEPDEVRIDIASSGETEDSVNPPPYSSSSTPTIRRIRSVQAGFFSAALVLESQNESLLSFPFVAM